MIERGPDRGATSTDFFDIRNTGVYWERKADFESLPVSPPPRIAMHFNRRPVGIRLGRRGGGVDFRGVEIPPDAVFQASVGMYNMSSTVEFHEHPKNTRLVLSLAREGEGFVRLHSEPVLSVNYRRTAGRDWTPLEVDLSDYAGEQVTLRLELEVDRNLRPHRLSWWGSPRIAVRPRAE